MGKISSGAFFYTIGKAMSLRQVLSTGEVATYAGLIVDPISPDEEVFTLAAVERALRSTNKRTALAVVYADGLALPTECGKGRNTVARLIELRNQSDPEYAKTVIDAMTVRFLESMLEEEKAA